MKNKITLLIAVLIFQVPKLTSAQDMELNSVDNLFNIFQKLNDNINKLIDKQEAQRLDRYLNYFKIDMRHYLKVRESITSILEEKNYNQIDSIWLHEKVGDLQLHLIKIAARFENIQNFADQLLIGNVAKFTDEIDIGIQEQRNKFVNRLQDLSNGRNKIDKLAFKNDSKQICQRLKKSIELIDEIKKKLKERFK